MPDFLEKSDEGAAHGSGRGAVSEQRHSRARTEVQYRLLVWHWEIRLYLGLCVLAGFLPLIPLIPLLCGALWMIYPSVVCVGFSAVLLSTLVLFRGAALRAEIIRRGHL